MRDAVVVGSGPNGLAAAITLARAGLRVLVLEGAPMPGGGLRSAELTLPGFIHDPCSAVFPLGIASPFFRSLPQDDLGIEWVHGPSPLVHAFPDRPAVVLQHSLEATAHSFGFDGEAYKRLLQPITDSWEPLLAGLLGPLFRLPRHPIAMARFGLRGLRSADGVVSRFKDRGVRALWAGVAAHLAAPLDTPMSAASALMLLAAAHTTGWPGSRGGTGTLRDGLLAHLRSLGGEVVVRHPVRSLTDLPPSRLTLFDLSPEQFLSIVGGRIHGRYRRQLEHFRRGEALFKVDYALSAPVPWRDPACALAPTVHLGDSYGQIAQSEQAIARRRLPQRPFVIAAQPSLFDPSRAPAGKHTLWAYCHVPRGSTADMADALDARIEQFAPGFRDIILARATRGPADLERENANFAGGDFSTGAMSGLQTLFRPAFRLDPYGTPLEGMFICSAASPPGPGVHGMCGYWAARSALHSLGIPEGSAGRQESPV